MRLPPVHERAACAACQSRGAVLRWPLAIELLSALRAADDQLVMVRLFGREPYSCPALRALDGLLTPSHVARPVGRIVPSARSRGCRAIAIGSPLNTSFAASSSTSCCAERISASMINGKIPALTGDQSRDAIVDARSSLVGIHARIRSDFRLRRNVSGRIRKYPLSWADMAATLIGRATDDEAQSTALAAPGGSRCDPARPRACRRLRSLSHARRLDQAWRDGGAVAEGCLRVRTRGSFDVPP